MTFSIVGVDPKSGALGAACTTSDIAVGARVPFSRAGVGAVVTQHTTDPRLGVRCLDMLASGLAADEALKAVLASAVVPDARQLALVDSRGRAAVFSGRFVDPASSFGLADEGLAVVGNMLANALVGPAIAAGWHEAEGEELSTRLVAALRAGLAAGGESFPLRSAAVTVHREQSFAYVDLRIDDDDDPLRRLTDLEARYASRRDDFVRRAIDPDLSYVTHLDPDTDPTDPGRSDQP